MAAGSGSVDGDTLMLDAAPSVLWFTDQPDRWAGQIEPADLADLWAEGQDGFADDPPDAVLSILDADTAADAVIELTGIASHTAHVGAPDDIVFTFEVLDGELPDGAIGTATLFIEDWEGPRSASEQDDPFDGSTARSWTSARFPVAEGALGRWSAHDAIPFHIGHPILAAQPLPPRRVPLVD